MPAVCDLCEHAITIVFVDGQTVRGYWAIMCSACYEKHGVGLGTGKGQKYDANTGAKIVG
jgi:hypothetical protein